MITDIQQELVRIRNEVKAQKVYSGLTYSQLLLPENTPELTYSGTASLSGSGSGPIAVVRFRFIREDGLNEAPMINFPYTASISPTYKQFAEANGFSFSADDLTYVDLREILGYIANTGDGFVDFYVELASSFRDLFFSRDSLDFSVTCQAVANVKGILTVERIL